MTAEKFWSFPVRIENIPETGQQFTLRADDHVRASIVCAAELIGLPRLEAQFEVIRRGRSSAHVTGSVSATVQQTCVVTLEPMSNEIDESVDVAFAPAAAVASSQVVVSAAGADEPPEPIVDGTIDLGALAVEFLLLGIDPYPRKGDAVFAAPQEAEPAAHPFAALAALKKPEPGKA